MSLVLTLDVFQTFLQYFYFVTVFLWHLCILRQTLQKQPIDNVNG